MFRRLARVCTCFNNFPPVLLRRWYSRVMGRKGEKEGGTPTNLALDPDAPAMYLNNALDESQPNAGSIGLGVEFVEETKYPVEMLRGDADAVVFDEEHETPAFLSALTDLDLRRWLAAHVFGGVVDQVLEDGILMQAQANAENYFYRFFTEQLGYDSVQFVR